MGKNLITDFKIFENDNNHDGYQEILDLIMHAYHKTKPTEVYTAKQTPEHYYVAVTPLDSDTAEEGTEYLENHGGPNIDGFEVLDRDQVDKVGKDITDIKNITLDNNKLFTVKVKKT